MYKAVFLSIYTSEEKNRGSRGILFYWKGPILFVPLNIRRYILRSNTRPHLWSIPQSIRIVDFKKKKSTKKVEHRRKKMDDRRA
jgi:hypothetical protein